MNRRQRFCHSKLHHLMVASDYRPPLTPTSSLSNTFSQITLDKLFLVPNSPPIFCLRLSFYFILVFSFAELLRLYFR